MPRENTQDKKKPRKAFTGGLIGVNVEFYWGMYRKGIFDGGGGNRTPVRKCLSGNVYMRSLLFGLVPENSSRQDLT